MSKLGEYAVFLREARKTFRTTGAILPSSKYLAQKAVAIIDGLPANARILEAGPGTGAVTQHILPKLRPGDKLVLAELNDGFVAELRRRLESDPFWSRYRDQVEVFHGTIQDLPEELKFNAIVCGIPFNSFTPEMVDEIFGKMIEHLLPGAQLSNFEYLGIRRVSAPFMKKSERARMKAVAKVIKKYVDQYHVKDHRIALNIPPAVVHHFRAPVAITVNGNGSVHNGV
jgi:phosphatidylethanolamine/phosphatidyl-N-methylethanolamine N-methyltransferase